MPEPLLFQNGLNILLRAIGKYTVRIYLNPGKRMGNQEMIRNARKRL
jgi:hypothetical protein